MSEKGEYFLTNIYLGSEDKVMVMLDIGACPKD